MNSRWFNSAVVILWLATMSWLVTKKILPALLVGEPPSRYRIVEAQRDAPPVGWRMLLNDRPLGWALSETQLQPTGLTEIHGRVHFDSLPVDAMMPDWLRTLTRWGQRPIGPLRMDARSLLIFDPLRRLTRFDSAVRLDPFKEVISVQGTVEGRQLHLLVRTGSASFPSEAFLPPDALLSDALSPESQLPGLRAGQEWTVPIYSPLWPARTPLEIIHAKVEGTEPIIWNGHMVDAWLVVYRNDPGSGDGNRQRPRGMLWVRRDGTVLRQEALFFDATVAFIRLPDDKAAELAAAAGPRWWILENGRQDHSHD